MRSSFPLSLAACVLPIVFATSSLFAGASGLKPLLAQPDQVVLSMDFNHPAPLKKTEWAPRQGTRWEIASGVLNGQESSPDYQAQREHHQGFEPRISSPITPDEFVAEFSIRFSEGEENAITPFVEFGHHIARARFSSQGMELLVDYESLRVAEAKSFKYEPGRWYHVLAELKGDEFVIQFKDGPTLYARHPVIGKANPSGGKGFGLAGPKKGKVELDNVTLWTVKAKPQPGWEKRRAKFPKFTPVQVKKKRPDQVVR